MGSIKAQLQKNPEILNQSLHVFNQHLQTSYCAGWGQRSMFLHNYWREERTAQSILVL